MLGVPQLLTRRFLLVKDYGIFRRFAAIIGKICDLSTRSLLPGLASVAPAFGELLTLQCDGDLRDASCRAQPSPPMT